MAKDLLAAFRHEMVGWEGGKGKMIQFQPLTFVDTWMHAPMCISDVFQSFSLCEDAIYCTSTFTPHHLRSELSRQITFVVRKKNSRIFLYSE